jgi:hypothetical protein
MLLGDGGQGGGVNARPLRLFARQQRVQQRHRRGRQRLLPV